MGFNWAGRAVEWMIEDFVTWPLKLTMTSSSPWLRVLSIPLFFVWLVPAFCLAVAPLTFCMVASLVIDAWRGEF